MRQHAELEDIFIMFVHGEHENFDTGVHFNLACGLNHRSYQKYRDIHQDDIRL